MSEVPNFLFIIINSAIKNFSVHVQIRDTIEL